MHQGMAIMDQIASVTASLSVIGSFCAGIRQFYLGYVFEGADGFSPALLIGWMLGDVCNLIGTFWTHQLVFQRVIAMASAFNDLLLTCQHFYYKRKHTRLQRHPVPDAAPERFLAVQWNALLRPYILFTMVSAARAHAGTWDEIDDDDEIDFEFLIGQCMAWVAELSYALALIPQALENFQRKSTGSVSLAMFVADAFGSVNYLATIMLTMAAKSSKRKQVAFALEELPYIFGTAVCALLDFILLLQYYIYPSFVIEVVAEEEFFQNGELTPVHSLMPTMSTNSYNYSWSIPRE